MNPVVSTPPNAPATSGLTWSGHMADDVGATYGPEPLATLTATADRLILSGTRGTFEIPRASVRKVGGGKMYPWFFSAVRIHHDLPKLPEELQFKPLHTTPRAVRQALREIGYPAA